MGRPPKLVGGPTAPGAPLDLATAEAHVRSVSADSATVQRCLTAAIQDIQEWLGRPILSSDWECRFDSFPGWWLYLPLGGVTEITSITYRAAEIGRAHV